MAPQTPAYSHAIGRLLAEKDLTGLVALLRQPARPELRGEAAGALGELGNFAATEMLVRASHEDPEVQVRTAARQALEVLFGSEAGSVSASYTGAAARDPWLSEPAAADAENDLEESVPGLSDDELEGFISVARFEPNERLRLQAIRALGQSPSHAATEVLVQLALVGDTGKIRQAATQALESLYGDAAAEILENYRDTGTEEQPLEDMDLEDETSDEEEDDDDNEEDDDEDEEDALDQQEDGEEEEETPVQPPSPYLNLSNTPVTEEIGRSGWPLVALVLVLVGLVMLMLLLWGR